MFSSLVAVINNANKCHKKPQISHFNNMTINFQYVHIYIFFALLQYKY